MKDKVLFFLLDAVVATVGYFVGDMETDTVEEVNYVDEVSKVKRFGEEGGEVFFEGDVIIKGTLHVTGGQISVSNKPVFRENERFIAISTREEGSHILLADTPYKESLGYSSTLMLSATKTKGFPMGYSKIVLSGNHGFDKHEIKSIDPELLLEKPGKR